MAHHRLMPQVKSVEIAERDDRPPIAGRDRRTAVETLHGGGYRHGKAVLKALSLWERVG
jgi:hypothetical protein